MTGAIRGTSKEKLYQELGLESLLLRSWYRKLGMFYKIFKSKIPQYLFKLIPERMSSYVTRNADNIPLFFLFFLIPFFHLYLLFSFFFFFVLPGTPDLQYLATVIF